METKKEVLVEGHGVSIIYENFENEKNVDLIHGYILQCSHLFPRWLRVLTVVAYNAPPQQSSLSSDACVHPHAWEYGLACVDIYSQFFDRSEEYQLSVLLHEIVHICQGKLLAFDANYLISTIREQDEQLADVLERRHTEIVEEYTTNISEIIQGMM